MLTAPAPTTFCHVHNPERAEFFRACGIDPERVPICSIIPGLADLPIGRRLVYELDLCQLSAHQRELLTALISRTFGLESSYVAENLNLAGVPILVEDTVAIDTNPWRYL